MPCGKHTMKWRRAMSIARREYPNAGLNRRKRIAGSIIGGKKKK